MIPTTRRRFAESIRAAGACADYRVMTSDHGEALGEHGITGNGHMMMLESNSSTVADFIAALI